MQTAVFGLGCDPQNHSALEKIIALKGRDSGKGMIIIAANYDQLLFYLKNPGDSLKQKLLNEPDIPTTWVVDATTHLSPLLTGGRDTIAVRITQHKIAATLCTQFGGAITSTSANLSGNEPIKSAAQITQQFPTGVDTVIDASVGTLSQPTRIIDARTNEKLR